MSRRRGEFEHRTSIFEGAFRAWSHLGGLNPEDVESKPTSDLDPLNNPIEHDPRLAIQRKNGDVKDTTNPDGSMRQAFPYEPLPRAGLAHPYVQAILSPWLGPDADNEAIQLGLTTLRTWWQHRRKGESGSAIAALGTEKMKGVVEGYTRHFFTLAHCLVTNDKEQPPRTLHGRMKELEKARNKRGKKKGKEGDGPNGGGELGVDLKGDLTDSNLSPLERLHAAQRRQLASSGMLHPGMAPTSQMDVSGPPQQPPLPCVMPQQHPQQQHQPMIDMKGKCFPGKMDLSGVADQVSLAANQLAHRGGVAPTVTSSSGVRPVSAPLQVVSMGQYGDNNTTPVVFVSSSGDIMIAMEIEGITCAHCVKIVETVLKGCAGSKSPIDGLLDAAADQKLNAVLIKIDKASNAKRVAFESARNLSMVGYTAKAKEMSIVGVGADKKSTMELGSLSTAFEVVANTDPKDFFDWRVPCTCPDNGVLRQDCHRHGQMNTRIFDAFDSREKQVMDYMAGCGMKYGMPCSCGPDCRCKNCPIHGTGNGGVDESESNDVDLEDSEEAEIMAAAARMSGQAMPSRAMPRASMPAQHMQPRRMQQRMGGDSNHYGMSSEDDRMHGDQKMEFFGMEAPKGMARGSMDQRQQQHPRRQNNTTDAAEPIQHNQMVDAGDMFQQHRRSQRNPSIISYGGLRHMSMNSETTFGRAMSGLSALSIDWENLEDFDLDLDHSAHINNNNTSPAGRTVGGAAAGNGDMGYGPTGGVQGSLNGGRRSSIRRPHGANADAEAHVSFKV